MTETAAQAQAGKAVSPWQALALSLVILPGLGQLLTGRKIRGAMMAMAAALWLPVALLKLFKDLAAVLPGLSQRAAAGQQLYFSDLQAALSPMAGGLLWIFLPLVVVWFWTLSDSIIYILQNRKRGQ